MYELVKKDNMIYASIVEKNVDIKSQLISFTRDKISISNENALIGVFATHYSTEKKKIVTFVLYTASFLIEFLIF